MIDGSLSFITTHVNYFDFSEISQNISNLKNISIQSQNVNSLNVSTHSNFHNNTNKFVSKLNCILKNNTDLIFMQDLRLSNNQHILEKYISCTQYGSYKAFLNSQSSSRGVAILIRNNIQYKVLKIYKSICQNVIILDIILNRHKLSVLSVYGPVQNDCANFFTDLRIKLTEIGNPTFLLLGDLNSFTHNIPINQEFDLDSLYMSSLPNPIHCRNLSAWLADNFAADLFRTVNPLLREFSYVPFAKEKNNRSRIDHCLLSHDLLDVFNICYYLDNKSKLFDHKTLFAKSYSKKKNLSYNINSNLLKLQGLYISVKFIVLETMVTYFRLDNSITLNNSLPKISLLCNDLINLYSSENKTDLLIKLWISSKEFKLEQLFSLFPSIDSCFEKECIIEHDSLVETLLNNMKNHVISFQTNFKKKETENKKFLSKSLQMLKAKINPSKSDIDNIFCLENQLSNLEDQSILINMQNSKYFSVLNNEKGSKYYSKLLKNTKNSDFLNLLHDDNNVPFDNIDDRNNYILQHFKKFEAPCTTNITLENFLGEHGNHPLIQSHKLCPDDKVTLDKDITLNELEKSLKSSNQGSAPGPDGLPPKFFSVFWEFLKTPLLKGFNVMVRKKKLTTLLRCSRIKLLQKNGKKDFSKISSLRPISNLCYPYKLFSGIISNRLLTVMDKICYKAQKAFSQKYVINECLLNCYELMSKSILAKDSLCVLSIDFSAAFDNVSHNYLINVLKFFNFGDFFISLIETTLNDRYGFVDTGDGFTKHFSINRSVLQGDRPSPDLFKLCINPLILLLVISDNLKLPPSLPFNLKIDDPKPDTADGFADDLEVFFSPTTLGLEFCKETLCKFKSLSGLSVNNNKTKVCIVGAPSPDDFNNLALSFGFVFVDEFTLLGVKFDKELKLMDRNWNNCLEKIMNIKNFWLLFNLSVPGKIAIIKTFMLCQINYIGGILTPNNEFITKVEDLFTSFINHNSRVAKGKIFAPISQGGLGLPNIKTFLMSLDILLFKKSLSINDAWTAELHNCSVLPENKLYYIQNIDPLSNPVINRLIESYMNFQVSFWVENGNVLDIRIFENNHFKNVEGAKISRALFTQTTWDRYQNIIKGLKFCDIVSVEKKCLSYDEFKLKTDVNLNFMEFLRVNSFIRQNLDLYSDKIESSKQSLSGIFKKEGVKSKFYRHYLDSNKFDISKSICSINRYKWTDSGQVDVERELLWQKNWHLSFAAVDFKDMSFKIINNQLKLNSHISHFDNSKNASCTFCDISFNRPAPKETIKHLFVDCPTSNQLVSLYFSNFLWNKNFNFKPSWILIGSPPTIPKNLAFIINIHLILIALFIYKCRIKKQTPIERNLFCFIKTNNDLFNNNLNYASNIRLFSNPFDPGGSITSL